MGDAAAATGGIELEELEVPGMIICCVYLRDGHNQREQLIFIPYAYYINFESTFAYHFTPMKA